MKIISVFNQKGGVGKTTTVVNLAASLGKKDKKVLIVDMDPQGNSTSGVGLEKTSLKKTIYDLVIGNEEIKDLIMDTEEENIQIIPSNVSLSGAEVEMVGIEDRENILKNALKDLKKYDFILVDCPPSLGVLSINALTASNSVLIPIQSEYYALEGVSQLMATIDLVKQALNSNLEIEGILMCMFDGRNDLSLEVVEEVKKYFKNQVFKTAIPRDIKLAEAPSHGMSIIKYDKDSKGALAYIRLSDELINNIAIEEENKKTEKKKSKKKNKEDKKSEKSEKNEKNIADNSDAEKNIENKEEVKLDEETVKDIEVGEDIDK